MMRKRIFFCFVCITTLAGLFQTSSAQSGYDLMVRSVISPEKGATYLDSVTVRVEVVNSGISTVTSAKFAFQLNGVTFPTYQWRGNLPIFTIDTITIGKIAVKEGLNHMTAYVFSPNDSIDYHPSNDTASTTFFGCGKPMSGTYTVGDASTDFITIDDAIMHLYACGISGPVTISIRNGFRQGFSLSGLIPGSSPANTVTFCSTSGNKDSAQFMSFHAIRLCNTAYLRFKSLGFIGSVIGVEMDSILTDVEFRDCYIEAPTISSSLYKAVDYTGKGIDYYLDNVRFIGNTIRGGYYTFYLKSISGYTGNFDKTEGMVIDSNTLYDGRYYGVYADGEGKFKSFSHNYLYKKDSTNSFTALHSNRIKQWGIVNGNRIHVYSKASCTGLNFEGDQTANSDDTLIISNNEIILGDSNTKKCISVSSTGPVVIMHNSVFSNSSNLNNRGITVAVNYTNEKMIMYNNMMVNGKNNGYPFYVQFLAYATHRFMERDYNNYYSYGPHLAYMGGFMDSIEAIRKVDSLVDQHSVSVAPVWKDSGNTMDLSNLRNYTCAIIPPYYADINDIPRTGFQTAMGCYSWGADAHDAALTGFLGLEQLNTANDRPVSVVIRNTGTQAISSATITLWIDRVKQASIQYTPAKPLSFLQRDTLTLGSFRFTDGLHELKACIQIANDNNPTNDTLTASRYVCEKPLKDDTLVVGSSALADYRFADLKMLYKKINECGVAGDLTIFFEKGFYEGKIDLSIIAAAMKKQHLTLTSSDKYQTFIADSNNVIKIGSNNSNVRIDNLTIQSYNATYTYGIRMEEGCSDIDISNNRFLGDTVKHTLTTYHIYNPGIVERIRIANNSFDGCDYGLYMGGRASKLCSHDIIIDSNIFKNNYLYSIYLNFVHTSSISHNVIRSHNTKISSNYYGIYHKYGFADSIIGNDIRTSTGTYAIYLNQLNYQQGTTTWVVNNSIHTDYANNGYGIYAEQSTMECCFNTIRMADKGIALYINNTTTNNNYNTNLYGNLFETTDASYAMFFNSKNDDQRDYNNYYNKNGKGLVCLNYATYTSIFDIQYTTKKDSHSVNLAPVYKDLSKNLSLTDDVRLIVPRLPEVKQDLEGRPRYRHTPIGAHEFDMRKIDAAITDFTGTSLAGSRSAPVYVSLLNMGADTLTHVTIRWIVNGVVQSPFSWKGSLPARESEQVNIGTISVSPFTSYQLTAWVEQPNGNKDENLHNDTALYSEYACSGPIAGKSYTVGGSNPDFNNLTELHDALYNCGIAGPVIIRMRTGSYGHLFLKDSIPGSSKTNTITFMPATGEHPVMEEENKYAALTVESASHLIFQGITFGNARQGVAGVEMKGTCRNVTFKNCDILSCTTATEDQYRAFSYANNNSDFHYPQEVKLIGNRITGGKYNIYLSYLANNSNNMHISSIYIDSNELTEGGAYGIYAYMYGSFPSISHNRISNRSQSTTPFYGIYSYYDKVIGKIEGNRISLHSNSSNYGMYLYYSHNNPSANANPALIINNEVRVSGKMTQNGIYANALTSYMEFQHNSVYAHSDSSNAYAFYMIPSTAEYYKSNVSRNLLVAEGNEGYPLFISRNYQKNFGKREWNNLFGNKYIGYMGKEIYSIADFQSTTGQDEHLTNYCPPFVDISKDLSLSTYDTLQCPKSNDVLFDINGNARNSTTTIGCYASPVVTDKYKVTLSANNSNMGTVYGAGSYDNGSKVELRANPATGHHFLHWNDEVTDNPRYITLFQDTTFTAIFAPDTFKVVLHSNDTAMGTVSGEGNYTYGAVATLKATAAENHRFKQWSDNNTTNPRKLTVTGDVELTAIFEKGDGIAEPASAHLLEIYPNPVTETLFVGYGNGSSPAGQVDKAASERLDNAPYEVTDITGRIVLRGKYHSSQGLRVGGLSKGVYVIRIAGERGKFVKE